MNVKIYGYLVIYEFVMEAVKGFHVMLIYCNGQNVQC